MKIAQVAPLLTTVPPKKYGGIERIIEELCCGLIKHGHEITLYAARGSYFDEKKITIEESSPFPTFEDLTQTRKWEINELLKILHRQDQYDLIHFHYEPLILRCLMDGVDINLLNYVTTPLICTFHNTTSIKENIDYYRSHQELWKYNYVFLSQAHRHPVEFFPNAKVISNGIPTEKFLFNSTPKDYLLFVGRMYKPKGIIEAIKVAKATNKKLLIAAAIAANERDFYETEVKPQIDNDQIKFVGEVDFAAKVELYKNAYCTLCPVLWEEPFGLVPIESLACGTPVIAFRRGALPEIIDDSKTGFIVDTLEEMITAVSKVSQIDREYCHQYIKENFDSKTMVNNYEDLYKFVRKKFEYFPSSSINSG